MEIRLIVTEKIALIEYLKSQHFSENLIHKFQLNPGLISVNGEKQSSLQVTLTVNATVLITLPPETSEIPAIPNTFLDIVYEDDYLLVINKPHDLSVIGTKAHYTNNLAGYIMYYYQNQEIKATVHYVNRLDRATSGLILVAKHQYIHALFAKTHICKKYLAEVYGKINGSGVIDFPIKKSNQPRSIIYEVNPNGQVATTKYEVIATTNLTSEIEAELVTGRTHQLRVHFAYLDHPIVGDELYGKTEQPTFLHLQSNYLAFIHPITKKQIVLQLPKEW